MCSWLWHHAHTGLKLTHQRLGKVWVETKKSTILSYLKSLLQKPWARCHCKLFPVSSEPLGKSYWPIDVAILIGKCIRTVLLIVCTLYPYNSGLSIPWWTHP
jgi:hypothetical protein